MKTTPRPAFCIVAIAMMAFAAITAQAQVTKKADKQFFNEQYSKALQTYRKCLDKKEKLNNATITEIYSKMARCCMQMHYYKPALQYFDSVIKRNPDFHGNYPLYAELLRCNGNYINALSYYYRYKLSADDSATAKKMEQSLSYPTNFNYTNPFVSISAQYAINTFGKKRGLLFLNNKLYYSTTGYVIDPTKKDYDKKINDFHVFKSDIAGNTILNSLPETENPVLVRNKVLSFAIQPETGYMYFVVLNKKGVPVLYCSQPTDSTFEKKREVKIGGQSLPVESITFTADGRQMIFSAYLERQGGVGNSDLWSTSLVNDEWIQPVNMGPTINTQGDETTPFVYNNTLFFASNGQAENYGGFDIYSVALETRNKVNNLKQPYNSFADDFALVINPAGNGGFFISTRDTSMLDDKIYSFSQLPNHTLHKGFLTDVNTNRFLADVNITVTNSNTGKVVDILKSNEHGTYVFFTDNSQEYTVEFTKDNHFPQRIMLTSFDKTHSHMPDNPTENNNFTLFGFELNTAYKFQDIFYQTADAQVLSSVELKKLAEFLRNNPHLDLYVHLFGYISTDDDFNEALNASRIANLKALLKQLGVDESRVFFETYESLEPENFPKIDFNTDRTYAIYFVTTPKNTRTIFPKTHKISRQQEQ